VWHRIEGVEDYAWHNANGRGKMEHFGDFGGILKTYYCID